ncbi:MAG: hypothetical protein M1828_003954 [Chrysothrix sp. TS-e1954]|nr:MAG: hypothetical protein M1828_003954 [Chrysothrix sp. TS-e1954]
MGSRAVFSRVARRCSLAAPQYRSLQSSTKVAYPELAQAKKFPVISYHNGERTQSDITVHEPRAASSVAKGISTEASALLPATLAELPATMKKFTLAGKIAVVTGGGRGLGFNMAQALAETGIQGIAIMDVNQELGDQAAKELSQQTGVDVRFYKLDVRDEAAITDAVEDIIDQFGKIDVLISSAGIADSNLKGEEYPPDMFRKLLDINVTGTFLIAQACAKRMIAQGNGGSLIFIASMSGTIVNYPQEQCCYNASKAAVMQLTKSLATEWARHGIRVNAISPGYMDTALNRQPGLDSQKKIWIESTPMKRLGAPEELNNLAVYLASEGSSYMTGANCIIDGGYTLW